LTYVNAPTLLLDQQAVFQRSNKPVQKEICPISPKFWDQDHPEEVLKCKFHHEGLDDRIMPQQSRIEPFEVCRHTHQTVPEAWK
jgi:hypothetical protein